ncbi:taurine catabolism dioxygenase TauD [Sodiomyces alkalinus F11]|uniref:Taurine catabolism dioxygenase TauD n=1 Tax=Sodiomyces alkalinus (strain CBS 110278 / VKM F-3762 / F11) TaxID=1314773 RepID=A0A3N2PJ14_SODAK|nr:taurine catabolism dioxygenase TauD [Sodiomyces alkalinus F11]ROT34531.1 taurine catabolism dioxygenase TauD [Sodiomyces alkalinus F11]
MASSSTAGNFDTSTDRSQSQHGILVRESCTEDTTTDTQLDRLTGPLTWTADNFSDPSSYTVELDADELADISNGLETFLQSGLDPNDIEPSTFPLSRAQEKLHRCAQILHNEHGFCVLRGLDSKHSVEHGLLVFLGLASYIGDKRGVQNKQGHMLSHITDLRPQNTRENSRHGIHTNSPLPFHTDMGTDVLALQVRGLAAQGGHTFVTSAWSIYNDLLSEPNHLQMLLEPTWPIQISKRQARTTCLVRSLLNPDWPPPSCRYILAPLFQLSRGRLMVSVDPARLGPQKAGTEDAPPLTSAQLAALEALQRSAANHQVCVHTAPGDILFINNWALLHRRDSYLDGPGQTRHLVRLWLRNSELGWPIPDTMAIPWMSAYGNDVSDIFYPVEPLDIYPEPKYSVGSAAFVLDDTDEEQDEQDSTSR